MRVRVIFKLMNKGESLPFHHQYLLAQFLKGVLVNANEERYLNYDFYNFSGLKGQTRVSRDGLHYHSHLVTLVLSAEDKGFLDFLLGQIFALDTISLGNLQLKPLFTEIEKPVDLTEDTKFICISPIVPLKAKFNDSAAKRFIHPETDEFSDLIYDSTLRRLEKTGRYTPEDFDGFTKFQILPDHSYIERLKANDKKFARIYSLFESDVKYDVRGYTLPIQLLAAKELQEFVFHCGLGNYTYKGFGMLDLANADPKDRTERYTFDREMINA